MSKPAKLKEVYCFLAKVIIASFCLSLAHLVCRSSIQWQKGIAKITVSQPSSLKTIVALYEMKHILSGGCYLKHGETLPELNRCNIAFAFEVKDSKGVHEIEIFGLSLSPFDII